MNIGFINPPAEFLMDQRVFISLGILRVATSLNNEYDVKFLDLSGENNYYDLIDKFITENELNVICLTATTPQIQLVHEFCGYINNNYDIKIILGGPHITLMYGSLEEGSDNIKEQCEEHINTLQENIDTIVVGDGEYAIFEAIKTNKRVINSENNSDYFLPKVYDDVAIPNRDFIDISSYHYSIDDEKSTNIISQIGCPYQCEFCSGRGSKTFNTIRSRTVGNIISEIDMLYKTHGYKGYMFYDDEMNLNKKYFNNLLKELIKYQKENDVQFNLRGFTRSNLLDDEQAQLMYDAGFRWLLIGFESGSDRILKNMNKGCTVEENTKSFDIARKAGLKVKALMSIGHPGENRQSIQDTIDWVKMVNPDETDITIVSVYPGSYYFNKAVNYNNNIMKYTNVGSGDSLFIKKIDFLKESNFYKSKSDEYMAFVYTDELSEEDIISERLRMEKEINA